MKRVLTVLVVLASACSAEEPPPPQPKAQQGRAETQSIRNTDAVGYSGSAIADQVDATLNKADENAKKTQQESEEP